MAVQTEESDCAREQTKAEQDVDQVRQRATRDQQRLDSGAVTSPKDLENLQREIVSLAKRQGDLEDIVLEVMERRESAQERTAELTERVGSVQGKIDDATARREAAYETLDAEEATAEKEREVVSATIPADLLKLYDKLRQQQGGIGAAKLYQRTCQGCRQELAITDINEIRAAAPTRSSAARTAAASWCARPSPACKERSPCGSSSSRRTAVPGATRVPRATAPWSSTRRRGDPGGGGRVHRHRHEQRRRVPGPGG